MYDLSNTKESHKEKQKEDLPAYEPQRVQRYPCPITPFDRRCPSDVVHL